MLITVNDEAREVSVATLDAILTELGFGGAKIATALDGVFVPARRRAGMPVPPGARLEILAPMQGG